MDTGPPQLPDQLFDFGPARLWGRFAAHSLRRHWLRSAIVFVVVLGATASLVVGKPKQWLVTSTIAAKSNLYVQNDLDTPTTGATEAILSQDNLSKIATTLDLPARELPARRAFGILPPSGGRPSLDDVILHLRSSLLVEADKVKETITLSLTWPDPEMGVKIVDQADKNFLADRENAEVGAREETLKIMRRFKDEADANVAAVSAQLGVSAASAPADSPMKAALLGQQEAVAHLGTAQLDRDTAKAAFQYRYKVAIPPKAPKAPTSGNLKTGVAGLLGAMLVAVFCAAGFDLMSGTAFESWQAARRVALPVLVEAR